MQLWIFIFMLLGSMSFAAGLAAMIGVAFGLIHVTWSTLVIWTLTSALITLIIIFVSFLNTVSSGMSKLFNGR